MESLTHRCTVWLMPLRLKLGEDIGDTDGPIRGPHDRFGGGADELPPRWNRLK